MAARRLGTAAEQGDASVLGTASHFRERRLRLRPLEAGQVTRDVLLPRERLVEVRAQQLGHGAELLEPDAYTLLADAARPEPHDEHAVAIRGRGRLVDALGDDVHGGRYRRRISASASGASGLTAW